MATVEQILTLARQELGYRESPAKSNRTKYGKWYGLDGKPWCMMFVMWIFHRAGASALLPIRTASCSDFMEAARAAGNWHGNADLQPGDLVIFDFPDNASDAEHVGIVEEPGDDAAYVFTIEGNTSNDNQSNGGMVMRRKRKRPLIVGAFRPAYEAGDGKEPEPESVTPEPEADNPDADQYLYGEPEPEAGDMVAFKGHSQFSSPYDDAEAIPAAACTAQVVACSRGAAHPFKLYGTGVGAWADFDDVKPLDPRAAPKI